MPICIQQPPLQLNLSKVSWRDGNGTYRFYDTHHGSSVASEWC